MSLAEYLDMTRTGRVQESYSGTTHVAFPPDWLAFVRQTPRRSVYVEFDVPAMSLVVTGAGWAKDSRAEFCGGAVGRCKGQDRATNAAGREHHLACQPLALRESIMLNGFRDWANTLQAALPPDVTAELITCEPSANPALRLQVDSPDAIASLVCWESGAFSAEVLDVQTEKYRCRRIGEFTPGQPLAEQLADFLAALRSPT
ncbi:hypothetical protein [Massilia sp. Root418]|jgi:hypothetical protein|uniref:immunity protein TriTu family protein n=1 Tax=Massilia sp. Root418 TaxID=1736532 RepID=UPI0012F62506|nr:hypothetical protein [Massilia sp. Root418]